MSKTEKQKEDVVVVDEGFAKWIALDGGTVVHGTHLISDKLVGIVNEVLKLDRGKVNFGVRCVEFKSNGQPSGKTGMAYIDGGAIAINLEEIWCAALTALEEDKLKLSITGTVWHELIMTILHETHHIFTMQDEGYREVAEADPKGADDEAEVWSKDNLIELSKTLNIEPSALADMQFFNIKMMELMTSDMKDEPWAIKARMMIEEDIMYHDEDNDITLTTFREYLRGVEDPDEQDDAWEQGVSVIDLIFNMDDGSVIETAEKLPEPVVVEVVDEMKPVVDALCNAAEEQVIVEGETEEKAVEEVVAAGPDTTALFVAASSEAETLAAIQTEQGTDSVALPDNIVEEQNQVAAAAAAVPAEAPPAVSYTPHNLSNETIVAFLKDVYMRLYSHAFNKCGRQLENDQGFTNPGAILEPVSIADLIQLHNAPNLIKEYDTLNATGQLKPEECAGHIRGLVFTKSNQYGIPAYAIYLNINGMRVKRSLITQNPAKRNNATGQYSSMALEARAGHAIAWILSEDENKKFVAKIRDNVYEAL